LTTRLTLPVFSSITKKSFGPKKEMPVGLVKPFAIISSLKFGSFKTGAAKAWLSYAENNNQTENKATNNPIEQLTNFNPFSSLHSLSFKIALKGIEEFIL
jgi:hypothetical protein